VILVLPQIELALEASKQHEASTHTALEQVTARLRELSEDLSHQLSTHRDELQRALDQAEQQHEALAAVVRDQAHQLERSRDELVDQARQHQQELEQFRAELVGRLHTAQATLQQAQQELEGRLIEQANQVDQVRHDLKEQQEASVSLRRDMTTLVEQQMREVWTALEQVKRDQAQDAAQFQERLEKVEQRIEQVAAQTEAVQTTALGSQKRADGQESRLQDVWKLLQGEIAARQAASAAGPAKPSDPQENHLRPSWSRTRRSSHERAFRRSTQRCRSSWPGSRRWPASRLPTF
jgi:chromosome segregation ATPase